MWTTILSFGASFLKGSWKKLLITGFTVLVLAGVYFHYNSLLDKISDLKISLVQQNALLKTIKDELETQKKLSEFKDKQIENQKEVVHKIETKTKEIKTIVKEIPVSEEVLDENSSFIVIF